MTKDVYIFDITVADTVAWLLTLREEALADDALFQEEKDEICAAIAARIESLKKYPITHTA